MSENGEKRNLADMPIEELMQMSVEELEGYDEEERTQAWRRVAAERLKLATKGVLRLFSPMKSRGEEVSELHYDFSVLTNRDFISCMDADRGNRSMGTISRAQALKLYYRMHDKAERPISGLDYHDLDEQASISDTEAMIEKASDFFTWLKLVAMTNR